MAVQLFNENCKVVLQDEDLPHVDTIITDPPYNIDYDHWDNNFDVAEIVKIIVDKELISEGTNIILFNGWSNVCDTIHSMQTIDCILHDWIIWDRIKGRGTKNNLVSTREDILWFTYKFDGNPTFNKMYSNIRKQTSGLRSNNPNRALSNVWTDIPPIVPWSQEHNEHPTQKPLQLMERCVKLWSNPKDTVLDFTMGSGTTGVACKKLNRNFIGIELNKNYFNLAEQRINNTRTTGKLFSGDYNDEGKHT